MKTTRSLVAALALALLAAACSASPTGPVGGEPRSCPTMGSGNC